MRSVAKVVLRELSINEERCEPRGISRLEVGDDQRQAIAAAELHAKGAPCHAPGTAKPVRREEGDAHEPDKLLLCERQVQVVLPTLEEARAADDAE